MTQPIQTNGRWWYLSFTDDRLPRGQQFLGACYVQGADLETAIRSAWSHGCNPGGSVMSIELPDEAWVEHGIAPENCNRLLTREEAESL